VTHAVEAAGPVVVWIADTAVSAVFGLALGLVVAGIVIGVTRVLKKDSAAVAH
jgi:predicted DNA repair protein MutK